MHTMLTMIGGTQFSTSPSKHGALRFRFCAVFVFLLGLHFVMSSMLRKPYVASVTSDHPEHAVLLHAAPVAPVVHIKSAHDELNADQTTDQAPAAPPPAARVAAVGRAVINESRVAYIADSCDGLLYVPSVNLLVMTMAKAGTSTVLYALYQGLTGKPWIRACGEIHDRHRPCWRGLAFRLSELPAAQQVRALTSPSTLRIGVQRDPVERLLSAFKSKYTCETARFRAHVTSREVIVRSMRHVLHMPSGPSCMTVSEFATMLDVARTNVGQPPYPLLFRALENHIRPQEFFLDEIKYNFMLNVRDLSDPARINLIMERLPYKVLISHNDVARFASGDEKLHVGEKDMQSIRAFAALSKTAPLKYE